MTLKPAVKTRTSSPDYPLLVQTLLKASGVAAPSKLTSGIEAADPAQVMQPLHAGLYVVATPIGNLGDITLRAIVTLAQADFVICEDTRVSGAMLSKFGLKKPLLAYNDHNADQKRPIILKALAEGQSIALISDAGMPLIADPGFKLVRATREAGHPITVIPGANAAITALAGSGLPTDRFYFIGFLPPKSTARKKALQEFKNLPATLVFYEAPQRLTGSLADMAEIFGADRPAAVARELTKLFEENRQATLGELIAHYIEQPAKGEIVILIAPGIAEAPATIADIDALLIKQLENMSVRDAAASVSLQTGAKKSDVYARAIALTKKS